MSARIKRIVLGVLVLLGMAARVAASPGNGGNPRQSPTVGYNDPTVASANSGHPMVACASSCSSALINQNTDALQWAIDQAAIYPHPWIYLPPGEYPIFRGGALHNQIHGVKVDAQHYVSIVGYGATIRSAGDAGLGEYDMFRVINGSQHLRLTGVTWSQRDVTNPSEQTHAVQFGNGASGADDVQVIDCHFIEGIKGDEIRNLGGTTIATSVTRVLYQRNRFEGSARTGISFQHGEQMHTVVDNAFMGTTKGQDLDWEPTGPGPIRYFTVINNEITRDVLQGTAITPGGWGGGSWPHNEMTFVAENHMTNGIAFGAELETVWYVDNAIDAALQGAEAANGITCIRTCNNLWIAGNTITMESSWFNSSAIAVNSNNNVLPADIWVRANRIQQRSGSAPGINLTGSARVWVNDNDITYHAATAAAGSNGFIGIVLRNQQQDPSGMIARNQIRRGLQDDGVTLAGRMLAGIQFSDGNLGYGIVRDNLVIDATDGLFVNGTLANDLEGHMVVSGQTNLTVTNDFSTVTSPYRREAVAVVESLAGGSALAPAKPQTFAAAACPSTLPLTLPDGFVDGQHKRVHVSAACSTTGTLTPAHFGDGTSLSFSLTTTTTATATLVWDAAAGKWWVLGFSNMTVNP